MPLHADLREVGEILVGDRGSPPSTWSARGAQPGPQHQRDPRRETRSTRPLDRQGGVGGGGPPGHRLSVLVTVGSGLVHCWAARVSGAERMGQQLAQRRGEAQAFRAADIDGHRIVGEFADALAAGATGTCTAPRCPSRPPITSTVREPTAAGGDHAADRGLLGAAAGLERGVFDIAAGEDATPARPAPRLRRGTGNTGSAR